LKKDNLFASQRQIDPTDRQIDQPVYELYGLTYAEIKIVEAANACCRASLSHTRAVR
jgi:hypothetical protein